MMKIVRWRNGKLHISEDGLTTVCGSTIRPDRARIVQETTDWGALVNCYNCAYRRTPPGYLAPSSGRDFPLRRECPNHPGRRVPAEECYLCDPSVLRPQNWPCPNGCTDPFDHSPISRYTRCTISPPRHDVGPDGRCVDECESVERAMHRANPKLRFDLADSATMTCYHCGLPVCVNCQQEPVATELRICDRCGDELAAELADFDDRAPCPTPSPQREANTTLAPPTGPMRERTQRRAKEKWSESEYEQLLDMLRDGLPLEDIADRLGRGVEALASRCQLLLPPGDRVRRADADLALRSYLAADPNYDWRAGLREDAAQRGRFYWDRAADTVLRDGWEQAQPLHQLVAATGASEPEVAVRLVELGVAASTADVANRLGCQPGATLDARVRLAADRAASAVWVLVADGLHGSEHAKPLDSEDVPRMYRHVSLHADREQAEQTLNRLLRGHTARGGAIADVSVTLAQRTVGDLAIGETHHGRGTALR